MRQVDVPRPHRLQPHRTPRRSGGGKVSRLGDIVEVNWVDSTYSDGWTDREEVEELAKAPDMVVRSVGFLFGQNRKYVTLVSHTCTWNEQWEAIMRIPKGCVLSIETLKGKGVRADGRSNGSRDGGLCEPSPLRPEREDSGGE